MRLKHILLCALILLCICIGYGLSAAAEQKKEQTFKVVKVLQGDLIKVVGHGGELLVCLVGIDAPEVWEPDPTKSQPLALKARDYLAHLVGDKLVRIRAYGMKMGKYVAGEVFLGKRDINLEMVKKGYAEVLKDRSRADLNLSAFERAEAEAREAKRGIWALGDKYMSPSTWCKRQKAKSLCSIILYGILQQGATKK